MPLDETPDDGEGGGDDPHHDREAMQAVSNMALARVLPEMSQQLGQCSTCTLTLTAGRAIGILLYIFDKPDRQMSDDEIMASLRVAAEHHKRELDASGGAPVGPMPTVEVREDRDDPGKPKLH